MTSLALPAPLLLKEARALAPIWLAATVAMWASAATGALSLGLMAFALGAAALGASSIGHEYAHRTLTVLLAQPLARWRLLAAKVLVLSALLVLLALVAWLVLLQADGMDRMLGGGADGFPWRRAILLLTPALGLCVAPWLTIACRSALAGTVFTLSIPALFWLAGQMARAAVSGFDAEPLAYGPGLTLMVGGVLTATAVGAVRGHARFLDLEAIDASPDLASASHRRPNGARRELDADRRLGKAGGPLLALVHKEIRLQSFAFVVAGLYALAWIAMSLGGLDLYIAGQSFASLAALYTWLLAMLIGASASAEERALGTREWQLLQPYPFWKQWLIKVVTIGALALTLGNGLAAVMESAFPLIRDSGSAWPISMPGPRLGGLFLPGGLSGAGMVVVLIAAVSLYASSICSGGLRALLVALPFSIVLRSLYAYALFGAYRLEGMALDSVYGASSMPFWWQQLPTASSADFRWANLAYEWTGAIVLIGFLAVTLGLASRNHRSAEHGTARAGQMAWIALYALVSGLFAHAGPAVLRWFLLTH